MTELDAMRIYARRLETKLSEFLRQVLELEVKVQILEEEKRGLQEALDAAHKLNTQLTATPSQED